MSLRIKLLTITCSLFISFIAFAQTETLKIATDKEQYPPFLMKDSQGNLSGFEIELGQAICREMNVQCEFVQANIIDFFPMLKDKKINIIMAALDLTEERLKLADAAHVYILDSINFIKLKSNNTQFIKGGLVGKKLGVEKNSSYHNYILNNYAKELNVIEYDSNSKTVDALIKGDVDFILGSKLFFNINYVQKSASGLEFFGPDIQDEKFFGSGITAYFNKNDPLKEQFDAAIKSLRAKKIFQKISQKYFNKDVFKE